MVIGAPFFAAVAEFKSIKIAVALLLVASRFHEWSRLFSGSRFNPEFPRGLVILFNSIPVSTSKACTWISKSGDPIYGSESPCGGQL